MNLVLTNVNVSTGGAQPAATLPATWTATSPLVNSPVTTSGLYLINKDFGIEQLPTAGSGALTIQNVWGTGQVNVAGSAFTSTTLSTDPAPCAVTGILITAIPSAQLLLLSMAQPTARLHPLPWRGCADVSQCQRPAYADGQR